VLHQAAGVASSVHEYVGPEVQLDEISRKNGYIVKSLRTIQLPGMTHLNIYRLNNFGVSLLPVTGVRRNLPYICGSVPEDMERR
jgi:hypothetical protein